jgi:hypothetical protein
MTEQNPDTRYDPGTVDAAQHGWTPDDPGNVGQSSTARGEDVQEREGKEPGRESGPPQGESQRPTGTSTARDYTGVDPQDPVSDDPSGGDVRQ